MRYILDRVEGDVRVCFDVNHITLYEGASEALRSLGDRIETLHISDHDGVDERHWIPGKGIVDWGDFVAGLGGIGYEGCLMHEARDAELDLAGNLAAIGEAARAHLTP
jgi:sugar phosphate isomerase/epimerase